MVNQSVTKVITQPIDKVFGVLRDLSTYPDWMGLVSSVEPDGTHSTRDSTDIIEVSSEYNTEAYFVTISGKLGPFSRSKKLRMVETSISDDAEKHVRFERQETAEGDFSEWIMEATANKVDDTNTEVTVELIYGGKLWTSGLDSVLESQIDKSVEQLTKYVEQNS